MYQVNNMSRDFPPKVTKAGTELPMMSLKGKPYLQVAYRLVWFREEHPEASVKTSIVEYSEERAVVKAEILYGGVVISSGHKHESKQHFADFLEKAETGAIGRALAVLGYGTQFEPDFDEAERIVDTPLAIAKKQVVDQPMNLDRIVASIQGGRDMLQGKGLLSLDESQKILINKYKVTKASDLTLDQGTEYLEYLRKVLADSKKQGGSNGS